MKFPAAIISALLLGSVSASAADLWAPIIGDWQFSIKITTAGENKEYFILSEHDLKDSISPDLSVICQGGHYLLEFGNAHRHAQPWRGVMTLSLDHAQTLTVAASIVDPTDAIAVIDSVPLSSAQLNQLATAQSSIEISFDGSQNPMSFPAKGTQAALQAMTAACRFDSQSSM